MNEDTIRVLRVIEYIGPRSVVEDTISRSIHGSWVVGRQGREMRISAATIGNMSEILPVEKVREGIPETKEQEYLRSNQFDSDTILPKEAKQG